MLQIRSVTSILLSFAFAMLVFGSTRIVQAVELYGVTTQYDGSHVDLLQINTETGQATKLMDFALNAGFHATTLTFHAPSGNFLLLNADLTHETPANTFAILNPVSRTATEIPITGLPEGYNVVQAIEYQESLDRLLVSFGATNIQDHIAQIDLAGNVIQVSDSYGELSDLDFLSENPASGNLYFFDLNGSPVPPHYSMITDIFGSPVITPIGYPPLGAGADPEFSPDGTDIYGSRYTDMVLVKIVGDSIVEAGSFGTTIPIVGLAYGVVPEPSTLVLLATCAISILAYLWRRRKNMFAHINLIILCLPLIIAGQKTLYADGIVNGGFEQGDINGWSLQSRINGDGNGNGAAQVVTDWRFIQSFSNLHATDGNFFVLIRATAYDQGAMMSTKYDYGITQTFSTSIASTLYFDYAGPSSASSWWDIPGFGGSRILLDSQLISTSTSFHDWTSIEYAITPGSHTLEFNVSAVALGAPMGPTDMDTEYLVIDNIRLVPVPEPSTLPLLGAGIIGLLAYAWRRRKTTA